MPAGSKVDELYKKLRAEGKSEESAARIAQSATGEALATGRPPKGHENAAPPDGTHEAADYYLKKAGEARIRGDHSMARAFEQAANQHREAAKQKDKAQNSHFEAGRQRALNAIKMKNIHGQVNTLSEWKSICKSKGFEIELDGSGKLIAHINGDEKGIWDPKYGGAGMGWFF